MYVATHEAGGSVGALVVKAVVDITVTVPSLPPGSAHTLVVVDQILWGRDIKTTIVERYVQQRLEIILRSMTCVSQLRRYNTYK